MDNFLAIDLLSAHRRLPKVPLPSQKVHSCVVIPKHLFLQDLRRSFASAQDVRRQAHVDAPRMQLMVDGVRKRSLPQVSIDLLPCCTQAVMGMPVEIMMRMPGALYVLEPRQSAPLSVTLSSAGDLVASKDLVVVHAEGQTPVRALVVANADTDDASLHYFFTAPAESAAV